MKVKCLICRDSVQESKQVQCQGNPAHIYHKCCVDSYAEHNKIQRICSLCQRPFKECRVSRLKLCIVAWVLLANLGLLLAYLAVNHGALHLPKGGSSLMTVSKAYTAPLVSMITNNSRKPSTLEDKPPVYASSVWDYCIIGCAVKGYTRITAWALDTFAIILFGTAALFGITFIGWWLITVAMGTVILCSSITIPLILYKVLANFMVSSILDEIIMFMDLITCILVFVLSPIVLYYWLKLGEMLGFVKRNTYVSLVLEVVLQGWVSAFILLTCNARK